MLVVGGEAKASARAGLATEVDATSAPDVELAAAGDIVTALEIERGLAVPAQSYAVQEDAIRRHHGRSVAEHAAHLDELWDRFAAVAATNPHAWAPAPPSRDRVVATPYWRRHCSQWNVDMAVAILFCSSELADRAGVAADRRVHPWAIVDSEAMVPVSQRAELHRSPAAAVVGGRLAELTGVEPAAADHLELYSCFPSAVQIQAAELGIDLRRQLTVTGGMSFGGGPLNSAALHGVATMVDVLRASPGSTGLVTAVSGMLTKFGASLWSTAPPPSGFGYDDVADDVIRATATVEVDPGHVGDVEVEGATVAGDVAVVLGRTDAGRRAVLTGEAAVLRAQR